MNHDKEFFNKWLPIIDKYTEAQDHLIGQVKEYFPDVDARSYLLGAANFRFQMNKAGILHDEQENHLYGYRGDK
ncbi:hypothetical protein ABNR98_000151 [Salmonella enterica]